MSISLTRSPSVNSNENNSSNQRRVAWSKLHDRNLSTSQKNRIVNAMGPHRFPDTPSSHTSRRLGGDASSFENMNLTNPDLMNRGLTKDFLTLACYNAIATGQIGLLKSIYKTGEAPQVDKQGNTPLHIAARCGQLRSLR
ncbi:hypothetical protein SNE40_018511 [Patella caerulea]|uniref:ANK_REP_REGION domain-containing protein n=1 Tax=Patella caerulea TaxID=87958 RepID=A0AAN8J5P8_PATCE